MGIKLEYVSLHFLVDSQKLNESWSPANFVSYSVGELWAVAGSWGKWHATSSLETALISPLASEPSRLQAFGVLCRYRCQNFHSENSVVLMQSSEVKIPQT